MKDLFLIFLISATLWCDTKPVAGQTPKLELVVESAGHIDSVDAVAFSPRGDIVASGSGINDRTIKLWDAKTGQELRILAGHSGSVTSVAFSPDGRLLASGGAEVTCRKSIAFPQIERRSRMNRPA